MKKTKQLLAGLALMIWGEAQADYAVNMPVGVTETSRDIHDLHMLILWICVAIGVIVYGLMVYSIVHHRKSKGAVPAKFHENTRLEIVWTLIPFLILFAMAVPATQVMIKAYDTGAADMTIKVTGYQWKWRYTYLDEGIDFFSTLDTKSNEARQLGSRIDPTTVDNYLLNVDDPLVIPVGKKIRILLTAADVLHAWWVPEFGWKKDAIPGFITDGWIKVEKPGTYRGQCAELCGRDHGFMPIVVIAKTDEEYKQWVAEHKSKQESEQAESGKTFTLDELVAKGEQVYSTNCAACHLPNGEGIPGTFPAIKGSPVALGPIAEHVSVVVKGKKSMPAFEDQLSAADLAAVITYQRNAFGNKKGDLVQPSEIQAQK
ncbi:cytochrome c oxidase subunit II [Methylococcus sp. EFPC2]|uniref:cytochrome c oxidase subunit II n=1 Tax=Methylococcus sp. EFPC2 TaxID=2812648 RepID=UPI001966E5EA|nr:cytochrome c oxidase subunit II [Methylococcus sp. EFPC2]QSA98768.1 cytochrome c oxidase subunit II [Methylococcus sp. EFPC2]